MILIDLTELFLKEGNSGAVFEFLHKSLSAIFRVVFCDTLNSLFLDETALVPITLAISVALTSDNRNIREPVTGYCTGIPHSEVETFTFHINSVAKKLINTWLFVRNILVCHFDFT